MTVHKSRSHPVCLVAHPIRGGQVPEAIAKLRALLHHSDNDVREQGLELARSQGDWSSVVAQYRIANNGSVIYPGHQLFEFFKTTAHQPDQAPAPTPDLAQWIRTTVASNGGPVPPPNGAILELLLTAPSFDGTGIREFVLPEAAQNWAVDNPEAFQILARALPNLEELTFSIPRTDASFNGLCALVNLKRLWINDNEQTVEFDESTGKLSIMVLDLSRSHTLRDVDLAGLVKVKKVLFRECYELQSIWGIHSLTSLEALDLEGCESLCSIQGAEELPCLKDLWVTNCLELDLTPLAKHPHLGPQLESLIEDSQTYLD